MDVGIVGASGYAGGELLRIIAGHPNFRVAYFAAGSNAGELVTSVHTHLTQFEGERFQDINIDLLNSLDFVFLALPHGESAKLVRQLRPDLKIVDLGADYRLHNKDSWKKYYHGEHAGTWVYGLPELPGSRTQIADSLRVANPGCYATAVALALAPFATFKDLDLTDVVVVAASGTTGAGRNAKVNLSASEIMNSLTSYKFGGVHQHTPEIEESIARIAERNVKISFTPILAPMPRGILATITLRCELPDEEVRESFEGTYANERFVSVLPDGRMPETSSLIGSNSAQIQLAVDEHTSRLIISIAIDNLGKGAAGQAIQNANLMSGFAEDLGLSVMGIGQ